MLKSEWHNCRKYVITGFRSGAADRSPIRKELYKSWWVDPDDPLSIATDQLRLSSGRCLWSSPMAWSITVLCHSGWRVPQSLSFWMRSHIKAIANEWCDLPTFRGFWFIGHQGAREFFSINQFKLTLVVSKAQGAMQKCGWLVGWLVHAWSRPILFCLSDSTMLRPGIDMHGTITLALSVLPLTLSSERTGFPGASGAENTSF